MDDVLGTHRSLGLLRYLSSIRHPSYITTCAERECGKYEGRRLSVYAKIIVARRRLKYLVHVRDNGCVLAHDVHGSRSGANVRSWPDSADLSGAAVRGGVDREARYAALIDVHPESTGDC